MYSLRPSGVTGKYIIHASFTARLSSLDHFIRPVPVGVWAIPRYAKHGATDRTCKIKPFHQNAPQADCTQAQRTVSATVIMRFDPEKVLKPHHCFLTLANMYGKVQMRKTALIFLALIVLALSACSLRDPEVRLQNALQAISADTLLAEIKTLSSDEFEGRKPGSEGDKKTVAYMEQEFRKLGLKPGNPNGTFQQSVPLAGITSKPWPRESSTWAESMWLRNSKRITSRSRAAIPRRSM